jgi:predicted metal-binding protein
MTKIGIIRCQELALCGERRCAGWNCFPAIRERSGYLAEYETIELVGFDTCGGCPGKNRYNKIIERGLKLKEKGAEVIHLSTCIGEFCPNKAQFKKVLEKETGLEIKEKTHTRPAEAGGPPPEAAKEIARRVAAAKDAAAKNAGAKEKTAAKTKASTGRKPAAVKKPAAQKKK